MQGESPGEEAPSKEAAVRVRQADLGEAALAGLLLGVREQSDKEKDKTR